MKNPDGSITEERIIDPDRNRLPLDAHAARALGRFIGPIVGENLDQAKFREGGGMRHYVRNLLLRLDSKFAPELDRLICSLAIQCRNRLITLQQFGFLDEAGKPLEGDIAPPDSERVLASFCLEEFELARGFQEPTLLLQPDVPFGNLVKAIDDANLKQGYTTHVDENVFGKTNVPRQSITAYRAFIVEGATVMPVKDGDDVNAQLGRRIKARKVLTAINPLLKGMDRMKYAMLSIQSLQEKKPIDIETCTILDDDLALTLGYVPLGNWWDHCYARFDVIESEHRDDEIRFRSSVGGDKLIV